MLSIGTSLLSNTALVTSVVPWYASNTYKADNISPVTILDYINDLYYVEGSVKTFAQAHTYTCASTATYWNSAGVLTTAAVNEARINYDPYTLVKRGILVEDAGTNLLRNSSIATTSMTLTSGQSSPDGGTNAYMLTETAANMPQANWGANLSLTSGTTYTYSLHVKPGTCDRLQFIVSSTHITNGSGYVNFYFNGAGSITAQGSGISYAEIRRLSNGWYRIILTYTATKTGTASMSCQTIVAGTEFRAQAITPSGRTITVFGGQVEAAPYCTSYIPTTTASATRSIGALRVNLSGAYTSYTGFIKAYVPKFPYTSKNTSVLHLGDDTSTSTRTLITRNIADLGKYRSQTTISGVAQTDIVPSTIPAVDTIYKLATAVANNNCAMSINGSTAVVDNNTSSGVPILNYMVIPETISSEVQLLTVYNSRISDSGLATLTA